MGQAEGWLRRRNHGKTRKVLFVGPVTAIYCQLFCGYGHAAAKQKGFICLNQCADRSRVIAELGTPLVSEEKDGKKTDVFSVRQGYSTGAKAGRAIFHGVADVFTLGLWEVVGTPVEAVASGTDVKVSVCYDRNGKVEKVTTYSGKEKIDAAIVPVSEAENQGQQK